MGCPSAGGRDADIHLASCGRGGLTGSFPLSHPPSGLAAAHVLCWTSWVFPPGGFVVSTLKKAKGIPQVWHMKPAQM